jgi:hypothetical protein
LTRNRSSERERILVNTIEITRKSAGAFRSGALTGDRVLFRTEIADRLLPFGKSLRLNTAQSPMRHWKASADKPREFRGTTHRENTRALA